MANHRVSLAEWTKFKFKDSSIYVADRRSLARQGLAGVTDDQFSKTDAVYFLKAKADWGPFDNVDNGFGPVEFDIEIVFLDINGVVLDVPHFMQAHTGAAIPHQNTEQAIEAKPGWFDRMGFQKGKPSPILIKFRPYNPDDFDDKIYSCLRS